MERILVIQTAFLGDAVLTLPAIQALKKKYPDSEIDVVAIPASQAVFASSPDVRHVFVLDKKGLHKSMLSTITFAFGLRKNRYTLLISPHRSFRTAIIAAFSGAAESYAFTNASMKFVYSHLVKYEPQHHEVRRNLELSGFPCDDESWKILPVMVTQDGPALPENSGCGFAAVAPGTVWATKKYPGEYFRKIIEYLAGRGFTVILTGGAADMEICGRLAEGLEEKVVNMAGKLSVPESVSVLRRCRFIISNDSAPTHLAMAAGIPALTVYCSTIPGFGFYPYSSGSTALGLDGLKCRPCGIHGHNECPIGTFDCAWQLKPESVIEKIDEMIRRINLNEKV